MARMTSLSNMAASLSLAFKHRACRICGQYDVVVHVLNKRFNGSSVKPVNSKNRLSTAREKWQSVIGLEIHAQINSTSKLFSGSGTVYGASTNTQVSFFDAALPGTLPVLNRECVQAGVLTALALGCDINLVSKFDRKHYFYADMPAGYQITQQRQPLAVNGHVIYVYQSSSNNHVERRSARLVQIQLEQDSGKSLHDGDQMLSLIDLNRAGVGLMEIITAPVFTDGDDASSFVRDLRDILVTIDTCNGKMAEGALRVDANISVNRPGEALGTRTEVKNLNSLRSIRHAIEYEIDRQIQVLESGGVIENETRSFDIEEGETVLMRDKEKVLDYRFMPEPNLPPLIIHTNSSSISSCLSPSHIVVLEDVQARMKELPDTKRQMLENVYGLKLLNALLIVRADLVDTFEALVKDYGCDPKDTCRLLKISIHHFSGTAKLIIQRAPSVRRNLQRLFPFLAGKISVVIRSSKIIKASQHPSRNCSYLLYKACPILVHQGLISPQVLNEIAVNSQRSCREIIEEHNLWSIKDPSVIMASIDGVLSRNPKAIKAYKKGKTNQLDIFHEKVLKDLKGKVDSDTVRQMIREKLN